jgi:hypothetical protein
MENLKNNPNGYPIYTLWVWAGWLVIPIICIESLFPCDTESGLCSSRVVKFNLLASIAFAAQYAGLLAERRYFLPRRITRRISTIKGCRDVQECIVNG